MPTIKVKASKRNGKSVKAHTRNIKGSATGTGGIARSASKESAFQGLNMSGSEKSKASKNVSKYAKEFGMGKHTKSFRDFRGELVHQFKARGSQYLTQVTHSTVLNAMAKNRAGKPTKAYKIPPTRKSPTLKKKTKVGVGTSKNAYKNVLG